MCQHSQPICLTLNLPSWTRCTILDNMPTPFIKVENVLQPPGAISFHKKQIANSYNKVYIWKVKTKMSATSVVSFKCCLGKNRNALLRRNLPFSQRKCAGFSETWQNLWRYCRLEIEEKIFQSVLCHLLSHSQLLFAMNVDKKLDIVVYICIAGAQGRPGDIEFGAIQYWMPRTSLEKRKGKTKAKPSYYL